MCEVAIAQLKPLPVTWKTVVATHVNEKCSTFKSCNIKFLSQENLEHALCTNQENFQTNSSELGIKTICRDHIPTFHVFRVHSMQASEFSTVCLKYEKAQFKVPLRRFLNTQSFYSVDEFVTCKDKPSYCT